MKPLVKGVGSQLCEAPEGPFRQLTPDPFNPTVYEACRVTVSFHPVAREL